ncbi:hypothetical protein BN12_4060021 [Nostocoides japonicum T1-X7]|uniref:Uncharacterized protein n=1 Tax=Nostocoides japonicum T1-X7 TaxID=1194083 RepID=A0A077M049_9MICO|nr:hypothetical protein BN12_4060021 [Tetrasphaera japonica T1-X7]
MPGDTWVNTDVPEDVAYAAYSRVLGIQSKLHERAAADPGRVFDDLFNLVAAPAFLLEAWHRVRFKNCSTPPQYPSSGTATGATPSPRPGPADPSTRPEGLMESPVPGNWHAGFGRAAGGNDQPKR